MSNRIVVGVDGSTDSVQALRWAVEEARLRGAELHVVHVWHPPFATTAPIYGVAYGIPPSEDFEAYAQATLDKIIGDEGLTDTDDPIVRPILLLGQPAPALIDAARGADLLVTGSRGLGAFRGMLLGSVSQHCVTHAPCSVVVVRTEDDA